MLSTKSNMIGLDLATRRSDHGSAPSIADEMISTPKIQTPNGILSPKFSTFSSALPARSSSMANRLFDGSSSNVDDVLMTPVLNTPKSTDVWSSKRQADSTNFSPETPNEVEMGPREPPRNLPMDSDIGLRSPCDGLLAKRRKQMREMNRRPGSFNSDSNSCDTPTSENSPRDLTTGPPRNMSDCQRSHLNGTQGVSSPTMRYHVPSSPRNLPAVQPPPLGDRRYEDFKRPANLQNFNAIKENDLPAHINPSPLAVPSPNWSAVERFFVIEPIRTPKNLDNTFFDFLGVLPGTPRSASRLKDRSPNPTMDCYSGRDQRLSPRLSPRFPIPEAPTDLSSRPPPAEKNNELQTSNEVQDLSTRSLKSRSPQNSPSESTSSSPLQQMQVVSPKSNNTSLTTSVQSVNLACQVKPEYSQRAAVEMPKVEQSQKSVMSNFPHMQHQLGMNESTVPRISIKTESHVGGMRSHNEDYDYCQPSHHLMSQPSAPCYQNPFYLSAGFHHGYQRGMYNSHHELEHPSPPRPASPARAVFDRTSYHSSHQPWPPMMNHSHHLGVHQNLQHQHQSMPHGTSGGSLMINTHPWNTPIKEEPSITPPPMAMADSSSLFPQNLKPGLLPKEKQGQSDAAIERRKNQKKQNGETEEKRGRKKGKGKPKKAVGDGSATAENKRQYVCQYCQRSYDWNYNLNRHQKYECGKENAFQCAKCGRKFPHKQNCVYHLKRKHKVVYETIDQYMTAGLVTFRGASDATGHVEAIPISQIPSM